MGKCCAIQQPTGSQRRLNGLQLPLHCQQITGWIVIGVTAVLNFLFVVPIQLKEISVSSLIIFILLYASHVVSHIVASLIDPSEEELRGRDTTDVPEFDRSIHAHVIENGRCHLCNIYTSSKRTKHCSICNKCVDQFDHHCKWLNNCIGRRNYSAFIICVATALLIALFTTGLCIADLLIILMFPRKLSSLAQHFINCSSLNATVSDNLFIYCTSSSLFVVLLVILGLTGLSIGFVLLYLCCFHVYIYFLGITTYEYYLAPIYLSERCQYCSSYRTCLYKKSKCKQKYDPNDGVKKSDTPLDSNQNNKSAAMSTSVNTKLSKAKKVFGLNKIVPHDQTEFKLEAVS